MGNDCGVCFYSERVDGVLFCNHYCEDVGIKLIGGGSCKEYVNVYRVKEILGYYNQFLQSHIDAEEMKRLFEEFLFENRELFG